jgi:hypothetical protein
MIALAVSNKRADAYDSVVDVLRESVTQDRTNVSVRPADKIIGGRKAPKIGERFLSPRQ